MTKIYILKEGMDALDHAIHVKWHGVCFNGREEMGSYGCELCVMYFNSKDMPNCNCVGCPINRYTGRINCHKTPYADEWMTYFKYNESRFANTPERMRAALNFYEWLIELRERCEVETSLDRLIRVTKKGLPPGHVIRVTKEGFSAHNYYCYNCGRAYFSR